MTRRNHTLGVPRFRRIPLVISAFLFLMMLSGRMRATGPVFTTDFGTLGGTFSEAVAVSAGGQVVGSSSLAGDVEQHAFSWTPTGGMVDLGTLGGSQSFAVAVNDSGQVLGESFVEGVSTSRAFLWSATTGMIDLGTLTGVRFFGDFSGAIALNNAGQVVGYSAVPRPGGGVDAHAFLWTQTGGMVDLGTLGGFSSYPSGINDAGQVVGRSTIPRGEGAEDEHAFSWTQTCGMVDLGTLGGSSSNATAINSGGQVVGNSTIANDAAFHPFLWTQAGGMTDLGTLGGIFSRAVRINATGSIVGTSNNHMFLWSTAAGMSDLGGAPSPYTQVTPIGFSNTGRVVGVYSTESRGSSSSAFSWTEATGFEDLPGLGGQGSSNARAANDSDQVVGFASTANQRHGILWGPTFNTPTGTNVSVEPALPPGKGQVIVTFSSVEEAGNTLVNVSGSGPAPPTGFALGHPPAYYDVTSTVAFSAPVSLCFNYGNIDFGPDSPSLFHFDGGMWIDVTTSLNAQDTTVCGTVSSLSPFAILMGGTDTTSPALSVPDPITAEATSALGAVVAFSVPASDPDDTSGPVTCLPSSGSLFTLGTATVNCSASDTHGNIGNGSFTVTVQDTRAPAIVGVSPSTGVLWPPNHKMVPVTFNVTASDAVTSPPLCQVTAVTSNEATSAAGDWAVTGALSVSLRANRSKKSRSGRIYTVAVTCSDTAGNSASKSTSVVVPHDMRKR